MRYFEGSFFLPTQKDNAERDDFMKSYLMPKLLEMRAIYEADMISGWRGLTYIYSFETEKEGKLHYFEVGSDNPMTGRPISVIVRGLQFYVLIEFDFHSKSFQTCMVDLSSSKNFLYFKNLD